LPLVAVSRYETRVDEDELRGQGVSSSVRVQGP
jgi:hypothetical protein